MIFLFPARELLIQRKVPPRILWRVGDPEPYRPCLKRNSETLAFEKPHNLSERWCIKEFHIAQLRSFDYTIALIWILCCTEGLHDLEKQLQIFECKLETADSPYS